MLASESLEHFASLEAFSEFLFNLAAQGRHEAQSLLVRCRMCVPTIGLDAIDAPLAPVLLSLQYLTDVQLQCTVDLRVTVGTPAVV
jgi:hypothetical protein